MESEDHDQEDIEHNGRHDAYEDRDKELGSQDNVMQPQVLQKDKTSA